MSSQYLLGIAIGPVQEFIAASRKARDLWAGSDLLSFLCRQAAVHLRAQDGVTLVFPASTSLDEHHAVANKIVVIVEGDAEHTKTIADGARLCLETALMGLWNEEGLRHRRKEAGVDNTLAEKQLESFVEWYAAWVPFDPTDTGSADRESSYTLGRKQLDHLLAGRKALRDFWPASLPEPLHTGKHGRHFYKPRSKSALDPSRESVIPDAELKKPDVCSNLHLRPDEPLDAVSLIKRFNGDGRFPSTSRIAIDPFVRAIGDTVTKDGASLDSLRKEAGGLTHTDFCEKLRTNASSGPGLGIFEAFPFDSQLFYDTDAEAVLRQQTSLWDVSDDPIVKSAVTSFIAQVKSLKDTLDYGEFPAYYAILQADGDFMGRALGSLTTARAHAEFSQQLGTFAGAAKSIVESHQGALIYAGGDDVLAFLPLDAAIPCADRLRISFTDIMIEALNDKTDRQGNPILAPTLSVGIAIGHYAEHLKVMLDRARNAEKKAKTGAKNALAVSFSAHSGGGDERVAVHSWTSNPLVTRWGWAIRLHRFELFPDRGVYQLDALHREFSGITFANEDVARDAMIKETLRIIRRKQALQSTAATQQALLDEVGDRLSRSSTLTKTLAELRSIIAELLIARRIARLLPETPLDPTGVGWWNGSLDPSIADTSNPEQPEVTAA